MTSALAMSSNRCRRQSTLRFPGINPGEDDLNSSGNCSEFPASKNDLDKLDEEESYSNRSASAFLSKLLETKDAFPEADVSPSHQDIDSFTQTKVTSINSRLSVQKLTSSQRKCNRSSNRHKPAEVFRKDLISAMKIPDTSQLLTEEYWVMQDTWRMEWEKGVQVPVNQKAIPTRNVHLIAKEMHGGFRMPRKMLKSSPEPGDKDMVDLNVLADSTCRYDLDEMDVFWLNEINEEKQLCGLPKLDEFSMEQIMEELETQCHDNMQMAIQTKEGLGIEYDEDVVCDVCRMPDCEEGNEMVFCDGCNLCVHQACYGILKVPEGNWLCRPCSLGIRGSAVCILCDRKGGAMKSTRSGNKWAHVNCALWIPEISIADPERMEPITKISHVPASRWALVCSICKERVGACIQCSVKHCVTAYHVTCAIEDKLDMIADCDDPDTDDAVIFRSYCKKHSKNCKDNGSDSEKDEETKRNMRQRRIMELEEEFYTLVKDEAISNALSVSLDTVRKVMAYWKLKRRANFNRPLITPKHEESTALAEAAETNLQRRLRMFTQLRQDLERVRNLCYMIGRREKTKRSSVKNMESVFLTQMKLLERRMCHDTGFDTRRMSLTLTKFGNPEVCELARKESALFTKTSEWMSTEPPAVEKGKKFAPENVEKETEDRKKRPSRRASRDVPKVEVTAGKDASAEKCVYENYRHKNGLQRKAFVSANSQRRSSLGLKKSPEQQPEPTEMALSGRKRRLPSNGGGEASEPLSHNDLENRSSKRAKAWTTWRTQGAAASPSAYRVKTENASQLGKDDNSKTHSCARGARFTRSSRRQAVDAVSCAENEKSARSSDGDNHLPCKPSQETTPKSHLVVKWDSDKTDDPEIVTKVNPDPHKLKRPKPGSVTSSRRASQENKATRNKNLLRDVPKIAELSRSTRSTRRTLPTKRQAALDAKNVSGALVRSCDLGGTHDEPQSPEQELRNRMPTKESAGHQTEGMQSVEGSVGLVDASNLRKQAPMSGSQQSPCSGKEDEDGGYKGDMDESDSEGAGSAVRRHKHSHFVARKKQHALHRRTSRKYSDTAESSDCSALSQIKNPSKWRRLKPNQHLRTQRVHFKGFKDYDSLSPSYQNRPPDTSSDHSRQSDIDPFQSTLWSKNAPAVGDACDKTCLDGQIAGGSLQPTVDLAHHPPGLPPHMSPSSYSSFQQSQTPASHQDDPRFWQEKDFYPSILRGYPYFSENIYYSNVYSRPGWPLTPKQKSIYAQQFAAPILQSSLTYPPSVEIRSPQQVLPDSTLSPEAKLPCSSASVNPTNAEQFTEAHPVPQVHELSAVADTALPDPVPHDPESLPSAPQTSNCGEHPVMSANVTEGLADQTVHKVHRKKKKKKIKRKKKKRRKKRKSSRRKSLTCSNGSSAPSGDQLSDDSDESGSGYGEYCVEYCSTLDVPSNTLQSTSTPCVPPEAVCAREEPASDSVPASAAPNDSGEHAGDSSKSLLLKIDRKRIQDDQGDATDDHSAPGEATSESDHSSLVCSSSHDEHTDEATTAPSVFPLKLTFSLQKGDRTLRSGATPRVYAILNADTNAMHNTPPGDNLDRLKPNRGHIALKRLGLLPQQSGTSAVVKHDNSEQSHPQKEKTGNQAVTAKRPASSSKEKIRGGSAKGRRTTPESLVTAAEFVNAPGDAPTAKCTTIDDGRAASHLWGSAKSRFDSDAPIDTTPQRVSGVVNTSSPSGNVISGNSSLSAQPERHWKKRKVKEHETSVTSDSKNTASSNRSENILTSTHRPDKVGRNDLRPSASEQPLQTAEQSVIMVSHQTSANVEVSKQSNPSFSSKTQTSASKVSPTTDPVAGVESSETAQHHPTTKGDAGNTSFKSNKKKSSNSSTSDSKKSSSKSNRFDDGLPPVSPYRFTVDNTHQQKMSKSSGDLPKDHKSVTFQRIRGKPTPAAKQAPTKSDVKEDPYEFC